MKILIVDDHTPVRLGLRQICEKSGYDVTEAESGELALEQIEGARPDLTILDLNLPGIGGFEVMKRIYAEDPVARILVMSMHFEPAHAQHTMKQGAAGYLSKAASAEDIATAIEQALAGQKYIEPKIAQAIALLASQKLGPLTERDLEILRLLGEGLSFIEIAETMGLSYKTIANSSSLLKSKLGLRKTADLVRLATEMRLNKAQTGRVHDI